VCLLAGAIALCLVKAAASPVAGVWEGEKDGRKAVTLKVQETDGILGGTAVFYIIYDNGNGELDGSALPALSMIGTAWDGRTLRFSVKAGGADIRFELKISGADQGELKQIQGPNSGEIMRVSRHKER
jgi:hypothetical protein